MRGGATRQVSRDLYNVFWRVPGIHQLPEQVPQQVASQHEWEASPWAGVLCLVGGGGLVMSCLSPPHRPEWEMSCPWIGNSLPESWSQKERMRGAHILSKPNLQNMRHHFCTKFWSRNTFNSRLLTCIIQLIWFVSPHVSIIPTCFDPSREITVSHFKDAFDLFTLCSLDPWSRMEQFWFRLFRDVCVVCGWIFRRFNFSFSLALVIILFLCFGACLGVRFVIRGITLGRCGHWKKDKR